MSVLVIGGAGYIGSHTVLNLIEKNEDVVIIDNMQSGIKEHIFSDKFYKVDIRDKASLRKVFESNDIEGVIHFGANSLVGESMENPYLYYHNNVYGMMELLNVMREFNVNKIVFSSTAATYGEPDTFPIKETDKVNPTNTYGETKLAMEKMMKWFSTAYNMEYVSLRYFNAAGSDKKGRTGELHNPETHLIPLILQVLLGKREKILVFGNDYNTKDGTCIRDYVHVEDLAEAHYLALNYLISGGESDIFNLGSKEGYSVKEVIETAEKVVGKKINKQIVERRKGDPAVLVSDNEKARKILGWNIKNGLEDMIKDAWNFYQLREDFIK